MNIKFTLITCFVLFLNSLAAQTSTTISTILEWKGIERWYATDSIYIDVLNFEGATHEGENIFPSYQYSEAADGSFSYKPELKNTVYIPLQASEIEFLKEISFPEQPQIESYISNSRGNKTFHVSVCPIVKQDNELLKLKSFDLIIEKTLQAKKTTRSSSIHTYANKSVLSQGSFVKVRISESGVYKLTYSDLRNKGIEPSNVRMFGYGGAVLKEDFSLERYDDLPEIAVYDTGSAILFYAQGINKWSYNATNDMFTHQLNPYSIYGYYFITSDNVGEKKRIEQKEEIDPGSVTPVDVTEFTDYIVHEKELNYLIKSGRELYGEKFSNGSSTNLSFSFPNILNTASLKTRIEVVQSASYFYLRSDNSQKSIYLSSQSSTVTHTFTPSAANLTFSLSYSGSATGYLNYLEVNAQRELKMVNSVMPFHNKKNIGITSYNRYLLETTNSNVVVWDVNDILNIKQIPTSSVSGKLVFVDSSSNAKSYVAIDPTAISNITSATLLDEVASQNIHGMDPVDMLIITHPAFVGAAETLAQAHYEINGFKVGVVTTTQVYNEFSSGTPDVSAYRWAAKMFYDKPQNSDDKIKHLLLFGKGSFDNRGLIAGVGNNLVLTYQSSNSLNANTTYVTDDYFGLLDDTEGTKIESSDKVDIGIGRFPVETEEDAYGVVNKTISYMRNENNGGWKNQLCFIGDDGDNNQHMRQINTLANIIHQNNPSYHVNKILLDAYQQEVSASGESYPDVNNRFQNSLRSGLFLVAYMGHANAAGWANENVFTYNDAKALKNKNLPLFTAGTCEFSYFDKDVISGGEEVVRNSQGGGIGCFAAARVVYLEPNYEILKNFTDALFQPEGEEHQSVGDALRVAKDATLTGTNNNRVKYVYFGDPAVKMRLPNQYKILAKNINETTITGNDTLRALSINTVKGIIANTNNEISSEFNGILQVIILDKEENMRTLANDAGSTSLEYKDRPNTIFKGTTNVENGEFEFTFMLPKDIKYNYGTGRMVFYAWSTDNEYEEAQGYCEDFIIGGSSNDVRDVTTGPNVNIYLNHSGFVSGGKVNETPVFTAHVSDENGINTSSPTPGHDIMLMVDNKSYILNDYYEAKQNTYKEGTVNYQFSELAEGYYTLMFRVWNLYNISTVEYLDFQVVKNLSPEIFSVICYPNPATTETNIVVQHDREDEIISMTVDIYDLSGRKIWSRTREDSEVINWNLEKDTGGKAPTGIYIYRVSIKDGKKIISSKANKLIIKN